MSHESSNLAPGLRSDSQESSRASLWYISSQPELKSGGHEVDLLDIENDSDSL
jgi:hypothetical protein